MCCKPCPPDDVSAEFCSDVNSVCCRTKLNKLLSDNWSRSGRSSWRRSWRGSLWIWSSGRYKDGDEGDDDYNILIRNDDEVWKESDLGKCKTLLYKVLHHPDGPKES